MTATKGILSVVGIGPGAKEHCTPAALEAIAAAELIVGYTTYIHLVQDLVAGKEVIRTGMTEEIGRARAAVERARDGANVALISSGDAGVYGMAGLVFEVLREMNWKSGESPELHIVPGYHGPQLLRVIARRAAGLHDFLRHLALRICWTPPGQSLPAGSKRQPARIS